MATDGSTHETGSDHSGTPGTTDSVLIDRIKARPWQDFAFLILLASLLFITYGLLSPLQQLPSPLYGGDVYYHFGVINHIYTGNMPWTHNHFLGEYAHYPWISHLLVALIALMSGIDILTAAIFFPLLTTTLAAIIAYCLGITLFGNRSIALLYALFWSTFQVPNTAASPFAELVVFPLFLLLLARADTSLGSRLIAGIGLGLTGLAQVVTWVGSIATIVMLWAWRIGSRHVLYSDGKISLRPKGITASIWSESAWFVPVVAIGLPIALLFWWPPLMIYNGVTPNNWSEYVSQGPTLTIGIVIDTLKIWFFNTSQWTLFVISFATLLGLILSLRSPPRFLFPAIVALVALFGTAHPLVKEVGIGYYAFGYIFDVARGLLLATFIFVLYKSLQGWQRHAWYCLVALFLIFNAHLTFTTFENDRWVGVGKTPNPQYDLAKWIMAQTPVDSVFMASHEETGFALNAMTGRKVLIARRTHASPFVDVNQRAADTAIILYGNNETLSKELIKNYKIIYLYEDQYSLQSERECQQNFELLKQAQYADASLSCLRVDPSREAYLRAAGIDFVKVHTRLDPASNVAPLFDMLAIQPGNRSTWLATHSSVIRQINTPDGQIYQRLTQILPEN